MILTYYIFSVQNKVFEIDSLIRGGWGSWGFLEGSQYDTWRGHEEGPKEGPLEGLGAMKEGDIWKYYIKTFIHLTVQMYFNPRKGKCSDNVCEFLS